MTVAPELASLLVELEEAVGAVEASRRQRSIAWWRAWHRAAPRTSQRAAMALLVAHRTVIILGGNRTGKTELARAMIVALGLGSDHPDAAEFWRANGLDPSAFPTGPGRVWIIALTSSASRRYHRKQVLDLIPRWGPRHPQSEGEGKAWHAWNMDGDGEARLEVMVPGYDRPAEIYFLTDKPGDDALQGDSCRAILHDEEGKNDKTWREAAVRLWDQNGWQVMTNTPKSGFTWVYDAFVRTPRADVAVHHLHSVDNPYIAKDRLEELLRGGDEAVVAARTRGEFVALSGRWWPQFSRPRHVLRAAEVLPLLRSARVSRFRVIDFGTAHPFACLWGAYLHHDLALPDGRTLPQGSLVVYREHYRAGWTTAQHVEVIRREEGWVRREDFAEPTDGELAAWTRDNPGRRLVLREAGWCRRRDAGEAIEASWADPEDPQQVLQLGREHELSVAKAIKARAAGHDAVAEEFGADRLYVLDCCPNAIREWEGYVRSEAGISSEAGQVDRPVRQDDHTCDCVRYLVMGVRAWRTI